MITNLQTRLAGYAVSPIAEQTAAYWQSVYATNPAYFANTGGDSGAALARDCKTDVLPTGFDARNRHFVGIEKDGQPLAVLDLLDGYPEADCVWLGLLMVHGDAQSRSLGGLVLGAVSGAARDLGRQSIQLAVLTENADALRFWRRHGFEMVRETVVTFDDGAERRALVLRHRLKLAASRAELFGARQGERNDAC